MQPAHRDLLTHCFEKTKAKHSKFAAPLPLMPVLAEDDIPLATSMTLGKQKAAEFLTRVNHMGALHPILGGMLAVDFAQRHLLPGMGIVMRDACAFHKHLHDTRKGRDCEEFLNMHPPAASEFAARSASAFFFALFNDPGLVKDLSSDERKRVGDAAIWAQWKEGIESALLGKCENDVRAWAMPRDIGRAYCAYSTKVEQERLYKEFMDTKGVEAHVFEGRALLQASPWAPLSDVEQAVGQKIDTAENEAIKENAKAIFSRAGTFIDGTRREYESLVVLALLRAHTADASLRADIDAVLSSGSTLEFHDLEESAAAAIEGVLTATARRMLQRFNRVSVLLPVLGSLLLSHMQGGLFGGRVGVLLDVSKQLMPFVSLVTIGRAAILPGPKQTTPDPS